MTRRNHIIESLLFKLARREPLTAEDVHILEKWRRKTGEDRSLAEMACDEEWLWRSLRRLGCTPPPDTWKTLRIRLIAHSDPLKVLRWDARRVKGAAIAATLLLSVSIAGILNWRDKMRTESPVIALRQTLPPLQGTMGPVVPPILAAAPDSSAALLTLTNGSQIPIDPIAIGGVVAKEGTMLLRKINAYTLQYEGSPTAAICHCVSAGLTRAYKLIFPDSSWVYLKKGASFRYAPDLRSGNQAMVFNGEGLFSVAKRHNKGFRIYANDSRVEVLGTVFQINTNAQDSMTQVAVVSGAVKILHGRDSVQVGAYREVKVTSAGIQAQKIQDMAQLFLWTDVGGQFHFDNSSLEDAVRQIADYYQADVSNPLPIKGIPIKGDLPRSLSLPVLLKKIELLENGRAFLAWDGKVIVVSPGPH